MIVLALASIIAAPAAAIHPPSPEDIAAIQSMFKRAAAIESRIGKEETAFRANEGAIPAPDYDRRLDAALGPSRDERDRIMRDAIRKTLVSYGLVAADANGNPIMPTGPISDPMLTRYGLGGSVTWTVVYKNPPPARRKIASAPRWRLGGPKEDLDALLSQKDIREHDGATTSDGLTFVWPDIATIDPHNPSKVNQLSAPAFARLLNHELLHFKNKTTPGFDLGQNREEEKVCAEELKLLDPKVNAFGFSPDELKAQRDHSTAVKRYAHAHIIDDDTIGKTNSFDARVKSFLGMRAYDDRVYQTSIPGLYLSEEDMRAIRQHANDIEVRVAKEDRDREYSEATAREAQEASHRPSYAGGGCGNARGSLPTVCVPQVTPNGGAAAAAPAYAQAAQPAAVAQAEGAVAARASAALDAWAALRNLAVRGCSNPGSVGDAELQGLWPLIHPPSDVAAAAQQLQLNGCQLLLFERLGWAAIDGRHPNLSAADFADFATGARSDSNPPPAIDEPREHPQAPPTTPHCRYMGSWCDGTGGN